MNFSQLNGLYPDLHDQKRTKHFGGPAFSSQSELFKKILKSYLKKILQSSDKLEKSGPPKSHSLLFYVYESGWTYELGSKYESGNIDNFNAFVKVGKREILKPPCRKITLN